MFKDLAKPGKSKKGQKVISTLTNFDTDNDLSYASPRYLTSRAIPNQEYFAEADLNRNITTRSSKVLSQIDEQDLQIQQNAKKLEYFKNHLKLDLNRLPTQSSLKTASSFSNRNLKSTTQSQFFNNSIQKQDKALENKLITNQLNTHNSLLSEEAKDQQSEEDEVFGNYNQSTSQECVHNLKIRKSAPHIQLENSDQVFVQFLGNVSRKQQQITKLIHAKPKTTKDKMREQLEKINAAQEEISQITSQNSLISKNNSPIPTQQSEFNNNNNNNIQKKIKSNSELVTIMKSNFEKNLQEERSYSVIDSSNIQSPEYFNAKLSKKSLFDLRIPQSKWKQFQTIQSNENTPIAEKLQKLIPKDDTNRSSFSSLASFTQRTLTTPNKLNNHPNKSIFQNYFQTEPLNNRKVKTNPSLLQKEELSNINEGLQNMQSKIFNSQRSSNPFERIAKLKINISKKTNRKISPFHRCSEVLQQTQSKSNSPYSEISSKIAFNILSLKKFFQSESRVFKYMNKLLQNRQKCMRLIFIKSEKKQEVFDNVSIIEANIKQSITQFEMQKKSEIMQIRQAFEESVIYIEPQQLMKELQIFYEDLENLCLHKMKDKVVRAFEAVNFQEQRVQENIISMQKQQKVVPLQFQKRKYLYMNQNILYMPEKLEFNEKSLGEFNLISQEARMIQKEIENNLCKLKQIDRELRNPYRKQIYDSSKN
ncbi:hypothetical protein TTHERM_00697010 (macronuclear) [Tetrahymena thermophila SB210]|uniref:Uncharacterized protein n=1 Tax=Tetrahymena thermophila (strain SB210) TaxID=312017 RepID=Q24C70_TETTS|nr:hypothetical protein TTHERM_00697010 [Tetrahymena thermophila SB210]EAS05368.1 hypothetical protein TTHERM_00697010 [Tetrahymena thermophila SB210]|eukprot:XP_001025613.1 hypothetical protein TTHERM_00697010 [Tetrahymena thermophila SB210]